RSGNLIREDRIQEGHATTHISHVAAAASFSYSRGADGRTDAIRIARDPAASPYYRMHRTATGRSDRLLGERCWVWRIAPTGELGGDTEWFSCETRDGVQLWVREQMGAEHYFIAELR